MIKGKVTFMDPSSISKPQASVRNKLFSSLPYSHSFLGREGQLIDSAVPQFPWNLQYLLHLKQLIAMLPLGSTTGSSKAFPVICCPQGPIPGLRFLCPGLVKGKRAPSQDTTKPDLSQRLYTQRPHAYGVI